MRSGRAWLVAAAAAMAVAGGVAQAAAPVGQVASAKRRIAFVGGHHGNRVFVASATGRGAKALGVGGSALISPNGAYVASAEYQSSGPSVRLYRVGGSTHRFFNVSSGYFQPLAWSADSRYLAVAEIGNSGPLYVIDTTTMTANAVADGYVSGASFAPAGSGAPRDELVFGLAQSQKTRAAVNLWRVAPDGTGGKRITTNGRSLNPIWGRKGIVFDREKIRPRWAPKYQLWLMRGSRTRQLSHVKVGRLVEGLVPLGVSSDGNRLIAEFEGQDTSFAWRVQLSPRKISMVKVKGARYPVQGAAISRDGRRLLISQGGFLQPAAHGRVEWVSFLGKRAHKLARGVAPSWNR